MIPVVYVRRHGKRPLDQRTWESSGAIRTRAMGRDSYTAGEIRRVVWAEDAPNPRIWATTFAVSALSSLYCLKKDPDS
jgi:hypothetical protein